VANAVYLWQTNDFSNGPNGPWFQFCDAVENVTAGEPLPGKDGVGLDVAIEGYASFIVNDFLPGFCEGM